MANVYINLNSLDYLDTYSSNEKEIVILFIITLTLIQHHISTTWSDESLNNPTLYQKAFAESSFFSFSFSVGTTLGRKLLGLQREAKSICSYYVL